LFVLFGASALLIAGGGLFSALSYLAERRTAEIGVRLALGARGVQAARPLLTRVLWWSGIGIALGLAGSRALSGWIGSELLGASDQHPEAQIAAVLVLALCIAGGAALPTWRAARMNPVEALRSE
jgi:ABC-type antimicrobial peptide transport system permease subunit